MRRIILGAISFISLIACNNGNNNNNKKTDLEKNNLVGKVKIVEQYNYGVMDVFGEIQKGEKQSLTKTSYNLEGYITEVIERVEDGYGFDPGVELKKMVYEYDNHKNLVKELQFSSYGEEKYFDNRSEKTTHTYNDKGLRSESVVYDHTGKLFKKIAYKYKYDAKGGYEMEEIYSFPDGSTYSYLYKYDEKNNVIQEPNSDGFYIYKYDEKQRVIEREWWYALDDFASKEIYEYDEKGNRVKESYENSNGVPPTKYTYEYDSHGNWIKRVSYSKGKPEGIAERKIEYYN